MTSEEEVPMEEPEQDYYPNEYCPSEIERETQLLRERLDEALLINEEMVCQMAEDQAPARKGP